MDVMSLYDKTKYSFLFFFRSNSFVLCKRVPTFVEKSSLMKKNVKTKEQINIFQRILEDKRAIRQCIQTGGNLKELAKARGIKFATP